jgi:hypothetical protein
MAVGLNVANTLILVLYNLLRVANVLGLMHLPTL